MGNVKTQGSGINTLNYDSDITIGQARWMAILRATENNPTLKELADELMVMYELSKEIKEAKPDDGTAAWNGIILNG
jgi:hypothetical protein